MSVASEITRIQGAKADLKTSIEAKGVTVPSATTIDGYAALVDQIQTGGGGNPVAEENDVIFIDYDGTIRYSYSAADFANLTALPANPTHQGLTAQGWNWSLADAKEYVAAYGMLVIGQLYVTDDGKTRLYVTIGSQILERTLYWQQNAANGVVIDWGDGSATETVAGTGNKSLSHTYSSPGEYVIKLAPTEGTTMNLGGSHQTRTLFGDYRTYSTYAVINSLHKVELGSGCTMLDQYVFCYYRGLEVLTVPKAVRTIRAGALESTQLSAIILGDTIVSGWNFVDPIGYCKAKYISIPKGINNDTSNLMYRECQYLRRLCVTPTVTTLYQSSTYGCLNLKRIAIPSTITGTIGNTCFQNCASLEELTIPSGITTIGSKALQCQSLMKLVMLPTTPPTISSDTLTGTPAGLVIYVPYSADHSVLTDYQGASNWSTYAGQIYELGNPTGCTRIEYAATDSSAWLDTGIAGATDLEVFVKFSNTSFTAYGQVYANYVDESHKTNRVILGASDGYLNIGDGNRLGGDISGGAVGKIHTVKVSSGAAVIDGTSNSISSDSNTANTTNIVLGNRNATSPVSRDVGLKIYRFLIKKAGSIVLDLVPVKSNGVAGFWDYVSGAFKASSSGTDFTAGPEI